ncbi:uncharacterized protein LOC108677818, partial [Hyalella azteca]|uniref:Proline dehydrogenase n=1 Tax=Hyalella azteca TaxID=294128 RepID=A0A8B7P8U3_HYAAZ
MIHTRAKSMWLFEQCLNNLSECTFIDACKAWSNIRTRARQFRAGERQFSADVRQFSAGVRQLSAGERHFRAGARQFSAGARQFSADVRQFGAGGGLCSTDLVQLRAGVQQFMASVGQFRTGERQFSAGVGQFRPNVEQYRTCITTPQQVTPLHLDDAEDLDFSDHRRVFAAWRLRALLRAVCVLHACSVDAFVDNSHTLLRLGERLLGQGALGALVGPFYRQFVAGPDEGALRGARDELQRKGVHVMVAPLLESDVSDRGDEEGFEKNFRQMLGLVAALGEGLHPSSLPPLGGGADPSSPPPHGGGSDPSSPPPICQAKITGHLNPMIAEKISVQYNLMTHHEKLAAIKWVMKVMQFCDHITLRSVQHLLNLKPSHDGSTTSGNYNPSNPSTRGTMGGSSPTTEDEVPPKSASLQCEGNFPPSLKIPYPSLDELNE